MASTSGKASSTSSWAAAVSVGAVEALKDQAGLCRWNYAFRSMHQRARTAAAGNGSCKNSNALPAPPSGGAASRRKAKESEEALWTVMYLSCWGPNN